MKKKKPTIDLQKGIEAFLAGMAKLDDDRVELCKLLVTLVDQDKFALQYIHQQCPKLSMVKLRLMERVGRQDFHPALLDAVTPGECMLAMMDYSEQVAALDEGVMLPVVTAADDGTFPIVLLHPSTFTQDQVNQVSSIVNGKRVLRSMEEQQSWLVDHRTNLVTRPSRKAQPKWIIKDGNAIILGKNTIMTPYELTEAAAEALRSAGEAKEETAVPLPEKDSAKELPEPIPANPPARRKTLRELAGSERR